MGEKYLYNPKKHTLHIKGYCFHAKGQCTDYIAFDTENESLAYDGRAVSLCKLCQKKRDQIIKEKKEVS